MNASSNEGYPRERVAPAVVLALLVVTYSVVAAIGEKSSAAGDFHTPKAGAQAAESTSGEPYYYFPSQFDAPKGEPAEPIATF